MPDAMQQESPPHDTDSPIGEFVFATPSGFGILGRKSGGSAARRETPLSVHRAGRVSVPAAGLVAWLMLAVPGAAQAAIGPPRPTEFDICQGCHGVFAQGNAEIGAPRIAGLDARYIGRQLADFRDGRRGASAGDTYGAQMVQIAALLDDTAIGRLSAYVSAMAEVPAPATLQADARAGQATFATCAACHGAQGEGGVSLEAPRLAGMSDWYLVRQFTAFGSGRRGNAPNDERGAAMRGITATVTSEQALRDVIAYAVSLPGATAKAAATGCADSASTPCGASH